MNAVQQSVLNVLARMRQLSQQDAEMAQAFARMLDQGLAEMQADDAFGTEGQMDPRGDRRDGWWTAAEAQPLTLEERYKVLPGSEMSANLLRKIDHGDKLSDEEVLTALAHFQVLETVALRMGPAGHMTAEFASRRLQRMHQYAVARELVEL